MGRLAQAARVFPGVRGQQFLMGIAAGLTAQAIVAFWRWLRAPALGR